jgi:hypothetical protein
VGLFDWLGRGRREPEPPLVWQVRLEADEVVVEDGRGASYRANTTGARSVRVVPMTRGSSHTPTTTGWQVALAHTAGDVPIGKPLAQWQAAWDLAREVCQKTELPVDELTQKMFSQVGRYTPDV